MAATDPKRAAWVAAAATALNHYGSWTGRVHIHKHLFITKTLKLGDPPFEFVLYDYGPYSFDLDQTVTELELFGYLMRSYPQPGYGPRYVPTLQGLEWVQGLEASELLAVKRVAQELGNRNSQALELIATCLWFEHRENVSGDDQVVQRVQQAKPKYDEPTIRGRLEEAHAVAASLLPGTGPT